MIDVGKVEKLVISNEDDLLTLSIRRVEDDGTTVRYEQTVNLGTTKASFKSEVLAFLTSALQRVEQQKSEKQEYPCATCTSACCYTYDHVELTPSDVERWRTARGDEFIERHVVFNQDGPTAWGCVAKIKYAPYPHGEKKMGCSLLGENGCTEYDIRPTVCREYEPWGCGEYVEDPAKIRLTKEGKKSLVVVRDGVTDWHK